MNQHSKRQIGCIGKILTLMSILYSTPGLAQEGDLLSSALNASVTVIEKDSVMLDESYDLSQSEVPGPTQLSEEEILERLDQLESEAEFLQQQLRGQESLLVEEPEELEPDLSNISVHTEALFLSPTLSTAQDFAVADPDFTFTPNGEISTVEFDNDTGIRAGIRYELPESSWYLDYTYTGLSADAFATATPTETGQLFLSRANAVGPFGAFQTATGDESIVAHNELEFDNFSIEAGREISANEALDIRLFGGLRFADIDQMFTATLQQDTPVIRTSDSSFDGFGPYVGGEVDYEVVDGLSLFGRAAGSLLLGNSKAEAQEIFDVNSSRVSRENDAVTAPVLELALGVKWDYDFNNSTSMGLSAGYEIQQWYNVISSDIRFTNDTTLAGFSDGGSADLGLNGFFLGLDFDFTF